MTYMQYKMEIMSFEALHHVMNAFSSWQMYDFREIKEENKMLSSLFTLKQFFPSDES